MTDKTYLFVDGSNLYAGQYELFGPKAYLNFQKLIKEVEKNIKTDFDKIFFYTSYSPKSLKPTKKEIEYLKNEGLFYKNVKQTKNVIFFTGYRSKTSGKEKEVDVKLTADLVAYAFLKKYNCAYLITGDADFLQALLTVKKYHKNISLNLLCFENKILYQGLFRFKTYFIILKNKPYLKREFNTLSEIDLKNKFKGFVLSV